MSENLCDCCETLEVSTKDYREDEAGGTNKIWVCKVCFRLNNEAFNQIRYADTIERKQYFLRNVVDEEYWDELGIPRGPDEEDTKVVSWNLHLNWNDGDITIPELPKKVRNVINKFLKDEYGYKPYKENV